MCVPGSDPDSQLRIRLDPDPALVQRQPARVGAYPLGWLPMCTHDKLVPLIAWCSFRPAATTTRPARRNKASANPHGRCCRTSRFFHTLWVASRTRASLVFVVAMHVFVVAMHVVRPVSLPRTAPLSANAHPQTICVQLARVFGVALAAAFIARQEEFVYWPALPRRRSIAFLWVALLEQLCLAIVSSFVRQQGTLLMVSPPLPKLCRCR